MKPTNTYVNAVLAFGAVTAAALVGIWWLLVNRKNEDEDDGDATSTKKSVRGDAGSSTVASKDHDCDGTTGFRKNAVGKSIDDGDATSSGINRSSFVFISESAVRKSTTETVIGVQGGGDGQVQLGSVNVSSKVISDQKESEAVSSVPSSSHGSASSSIAANFVSSGIVVDPCSEKKSVKVQEKGKEPSLSQSSAQPNLSKPSCQSDDASPAVSSEPQPVVESLEDQNVDAQVSETKQTSIPTLVPESLKQVVAETRLQSERVGVSASASPGLSSQSRSSNRDCVAENVEEIFSQSVDRLENSSTTKISKLGQPTSGAAHSVSQPSTAFSEESAKGDFFVQDTLSEIGLSNTTPISAGSSAFSSLSDSWSVPTSSLENTETVTSQLNITLQTSSTVQQTSDTAVEGDQSNTKVSNINESEINKVDAQDISKDIQVDSSSSRETVIEAGGGSGVEDTLIKVNTNSAATSEQETDSKAASVILGTSADNSVTSSGKRDLKASAEKTVESAEKHSEKQNLTENDADVGEQKSKSTKLSSKSAPSPPKSASSPSTASHSHSMSVSPPASSSPSSKRQRNRRRNRSDTYDRTSERDSTSRGSSGVSENGRVTDSGSPGCDTNSEASNDSGRGGSVGESLIPVGECGRYDFNFPAELCGRLIGRGGRNIQRIKDQTGATITLASNPFTPEYQICHVQGSQAEIDRALAMIRRRFPVSQYPHLDMTGLAPQPRFPLVPAEVMEPQLPEGVSIYVVVTAVVSGGHIFVQQHPHPLLNALEKLSHIMNECYNRQNTPGLPQPVEGGIICACQSEGQWYRVLIVQVYHEQGTCDIKYVDYGGYDTVPINSLKQLRDDFCTLPFQAVECYLANIAPLQGEECFSTEAADVLMELTGGQVLQAQVVAKADDSRGCLHLYQVSGNKVLMINREMVNREVVQWIEML